MYPFFRSLLFQLDAEKAHMVSMASLRLAEKLGLLGLLFPEQECIAAVEVMGLSFPNRIGLAAGLDKEGNTIDALGRLGFGFIEIGTITPRPQEGNPKPRLFRLQPEQAIINRMGFNNPGIADGVENVRKSRHFSGIIGFNIGKNKDTPNEDAASDYLQCLRAAYPVADYITVNLSSPNTPGLRDLQNTDSTAKLLTALKEDQAKLQQEYGKYVPVTFKVAPDLSDDHIDALATVFLNGGLDGLVATNTTLSRQGVETNPLHREAGGLSGPPEKNLSTHVIQRFSSHLKGKIPIIGVGGISSVSDAREKIEAGASLIQLYTSFIYQGPKIVRELLGELSTTDLTSQGEISPRLDE
jgi:dihydroorotate dehydrogenase